MAEGRFAEHFDRVSDIVRKYLGLRFGFDGLESTTREALAVLPQEGVVGHHVETRGGVEHSGRLEERPARLEREQYRRDQSDAVLSI